MNDKKDWYLEWEREKEEREEQIRQEQQIMEAKKAADLNKFDSNSFTLNPKNQLEINFPFFEGLNIKVSETKDRAR